jgi:hypothetical protein
MEVKTAMFELKIQHTKLLLDGKCLFILTAIGVLLGGSGTTIRQNTQIKHITQNNTPRSNKTGHKTTHIMKDSGQTMNKMQILLKLTQMELQLQSYKLILIKNKHTIH